jgi:hypothetical protein
MQRGRAKMCITLNPEDFCVICAKMSKLTFRVGIKGEKLMDTDLKFSLTPRLLCWLIVAAGLTAALH